MDLPAVESVWAITLRFFASFESNSIDRRNSASGTPRPIAYSSASPNDSISVPCVGAVLTMLRPRTFTVDRLVLLRVHAQPAQPESTSTCKSMAQLHVRKVIRRSKSQHDRSCANQVPQQVFAPSDTLPCPGSHIPTQLFCRPVHTTTTFQLQSCTQSALQSSVACQEQS